MSDVGEVAGAIKEGLKVALTFLNPSQQKLMAKAEKEQLSNENQFKINLLEGDVGNTNRMLDAVCSVSEPPQLTEAEYTQLRTLVANLDGASLLTLYCIGAENSKLRDQLQVALTTSKS